MLHRSIPALAGVAVIVVLGVVALGIGRTSLSEAKDERLADRVNVLDTLSLNVADQADPQVDQPRVDSSPFSPEGGPANALLLKQFHTSDDPAALVALVTADGRTLASDPAGVTVDPATFGSYWAEALEGRAVVGDVARNHGVVTSPTLVPVGLPDPWGVLVLLKPGPGSAGQAYMEQVGSLNGKPGGFTITDSKGVAYVSWSLDLVGQPLLTPAEQAALTQGTSRVWTRVDDGQEWTFIGRDVTDDGISFVFQQRTVDLYSDLESAQRTRDLTTIAVLGAALGALVIFQLSREVAARRAEARVHTLLKNSQDLVLVADLDGTLRFVSPAIEGLLRVPPEDWVGTRVSDACHPDDAAGLTWLLRHPETGPLLNVRFATPDGAERYFDVEARDLRDHPEVGGVLLTCHEIGQRKELQDELSHQATHDQLTGLANRAELSDRLERLLRDGQPLRPFALIYIDLDHFKPVNDTLGHDAGDEVLVTVAGRMREAAGPGSFVSRLGGDEFAVLLDGADEAHAVTIAEALRAAARAPVAIGSRLAHLDASIGIALAEPGTELMNVEQLVRWADAAMYEAKRSGRGRWSVAVPPDDTGTEVTTALIERADPLAADPSQPVDHSLDTDADTVVEPAPVAEQSRRRRRLASAVPIVVAVGVVVAVAGFGFRQSAEGERAAEADKVTQYQQIAGRASAFYSSLYDSPALTKAAGSAPWTLNGGPVDATVAKAFATAPTAGAEAVAVLATPEGRKLASYPPSAPLTVPTSSRIWQDAVQLGIGNQVSSITDPDQARSYFVLPVRRDGRTVAVLALGLSIRNGPQQHALEQGGAAGFDTGGWSMVDGQGVIYMSWNPDLIGTRLFDASDMVGTAPGDTRDLSTDDHIIVASPMSSTIDPTYVAYAMPTADFFRDLRLGQEQRDIAFAAVLAAAVIGLAVVNQRRERAVRRSEARLDSLLQQAHDVVLVLDADGYASFVSTAVQRLLGYRRDELQRRQLLELVHPEDRARIVDMMTAANARGAGSATDVRVMGAGFDYHWFDIDAVDLRTDREVQGLLLTCHEVTERRALQDQLAYRALHDPLTGLPNRVTLANHLGCLAVTDPSAPFAVLFVDLDHFKPVNDTLGHDAGDEVLRTIARRFQSSVRVDGGDLVCRLGGDEFAVVLANTTDGIARATAERLIEVAREPISVGGNVVHIGATIGISQSHPDRDTPDSAIRNADHAMYQAKEAGRGRYAVFCADADEQDLSGRMS